MLKDTQRVIERYHDDSHGSMLCIVVAPCSPFSVSRELMKQSAALARSVKVSMHTHLAKNDNHICYSRKKFNITPALYVDDPGWVEPDIWHEHCVTLDRHGMALLVRTGTGVAHCPCSNMHTGSGIEPVRHMCDAGVHVGIGVDFSAINDSSDMRAEVHQAMLLQCVGFGPDAMMARQAMELATLSGTKVFNRDDEDAITPGMMADLAIFDLDSPGLTRAGPDPVASLVFCNPGQVAYSIINGKIRVRDGQLAGIELPAVMRQHNQLARKLAG